MMLALELAGRGRGAVEPNPMVGTVLVRDGVELGRGWHRRFGGPHAEIEAIAAAKAAGGDLRGATIYVTLEPCCHHGKTPPCTEALISAGVRRVVAAMEDPDSHVAGRGFAALRAAGIEVTVGVCQAHALRLLAPYVKLRTTRRPWVICKWAQTTDGLLALPAGAGRWISSQQSRDYAHKLRGRCQAVCVGVGTVLADDPLLTNRSADAPAQPLRIVLDAALRTPPDCQLAATAARWPVLLATTTAAIAASPQQAQALRAAGIELLELPAAGASAGQNTGPTVDLSALLDELGRREHTYLLVEGGAEVLREFIHGRLADELLVFVCPHHVPASAAGRLPRLDIAELRDTLALPAPQEQRFGDDLLQRYVLS